MKRLLIRLLIRALAVFALGVVSGLLAAALGVEDPPVFFLALASAAIFNGGIVRSAPARVVRLPGSVARTIIRRVYSRRTAGRVFDQIIADMQEEWTDAIAERRPYHAAWIRLRGYFSIAEAVVLQLPVSLAQRLYELWRISR